MENDKGSTNRNPKPDITRSMVEGAGVGIFETKLDGTIVDANTMLAEYLGFESVAQLLASGISSHDFYAEPEEQRRIRAAIERGETVHGRVLVKTRSGTGTFWANEHSSAVRDENGRIVSYVGSFMDVTDLVETQRKLEDAEASYRRIFERATEGIYRSSLDGKQLRSNPALFRLNGYSSEEEHLNAVKDIATEWYADPTRRDEFKRILERDGVLENFESEIYRHGSRERIWISENAYLVRGDDGQPLYYEGTVRDITERKKAELATRQALEKAQAASRAKTDFLAHMSHELRTPLNAILGFSDVLRNMSAELPAEKVSEYASDIHRSGGFLLDLINDVLDLARIESGAMPFELTPIAVDDAVAEALNTLRPMAIEKEIRLKFDIDGKDRVLGDVRALRQCLLNLLSNAVKFTPRGSTIRIDTDRTVAGRLIINVRDSGSGVPAHVVEKLGEPFITHENPSQTKTTGSGLGLAITQSLMERMSGMLKIENTGTGAVASLELPLA